MGQTILCRLPRVYAAAYGFLSLPMRRLPLGVYWSSSVARHQSPNYFLIRCSLPLSQCRGQAFDGAANMSEENNGVQALIKKEECRALYMCTVWLTISIYASRELQVGIKIIRNMMEFAYELIHNFHLNC